MPALNVAFLWHMHQPCYREPDNRVFRLPWVRLHALKDYYDMVSIAQQHPDIKLCFNLVPVLLEQLQDYVSGSCSDLHLEVSKKPAADLNNEEKLFVLRDFFMANWANMVEVHPRYRELLGKRGRNPKPGDLADIARRFSVQDIRDLQVWFNLGWTDPVHFQNDPQLARLKAKGSNFTEEDKGLLWNSQQAILASIIPLYKQAWDSGQLEISTTPYYHPILPLLCDSNIARESMPGAPLPPAFVFPEDALAQITQGLDYLEKIFGRRPAGMWPSEGSVSRETVELMDRTGVRWLASDEGILERSLGRHLRRGHELAHPEILYRPYRLGSCSLFFRDRVISDKLGFDYYNWDPAQAARDLVARLEQSAEKLGAEAAKHIAPIILDGENVWEFFPDDGHEFLNQLYGRLSSSQKLRCCTFSQYLDEQHDLPGLTKLFPGSWINSDFRIWIGAEEDNEAWEQLLRARQAVQQSQKTLEGDPERYRQVMEQIYTAEGSDWCWWYGGNFSSENLAEFDELFRGHLRAVYKLLEMEAPERLFRPIAKEGAERQPVSQPIGFITPAIDGRVTEFYEWSGSGVYDVHLNGGAMRRSQSFFSQVHFGFDPGNFYLRLDPSPGSNLGSLGDARLKVELLSPVRRTMIFRLKEQQGPEGCLIAADRIVEMKIPFELTGAKAGESVGLLLILEEGGNELEKHPDGPPITIKVPGRDFEDHYWQA
ncbi:MAG: hypothetical protein A2509_11975 [Candidatus Edwardsbacteria bacterium RIFOXYD12_FULL_50_11]|uniref:Glycoside hydrolase family 57 N-terminal domain-containing protein n=1 Tax=Candidatus Edwardsbacteria bacterium GWF2_54_11 TaxID=1817851 RepID=A0A1F5QYD9_9BACT|nr:MAG: hypothetical protein A2502_04085 [Candidatus Edwardsbacteria bacterium RifOxyC12_full_54_24]OGF07197.1 MAG: hypothetical protein A2024_09780 [Candidatus Edwardsbacteria bacterium GWF2_54_11]OGF11358.1 MAG: hypothetical protein A3K15_03280 [Candidatus Edwardsbacteria bacterium GWE2_54_12]OGF16835.1 MAG: hypothetical protein A2509_11975 [Candidatus Edwardsbacteria bacterium RIFOXYD12_FULL_50_11]OGJ18036.1 MAG: hypothetical protein A2349_04920 [Candidatus Edwardsbacteria bacterium RifOxyB1